MSADPPVPPPDHAIALEIEGMHCAGCVSGVEQALQRVPGVRSAAVNLATRRARVLCATSQSPSVDQLIAAVKAAGYTAGLPTRRADAAHSPGTVDAGAADADAPAPLGPDFSAERAALRRQAWRLALAALLGLPVILWHMGSWFLAAPGHTHAGAGGTAHATALPAWLQLLLTLAVCVVGAGGMIAGGLRALRAGRANMDLLVTIGAAGALVAGAVGAVVHDAALLMLLESAVMIVLFVGFGKQLEARARLRACDGLARLGRRIPSQAALLTDQGIERVPSERIRPGMRVQIAPHEAVPVDGIVREGAVTVDESLLTGESLPLPRQPGERVLGGSRVVEGLAVVEATASGATSAAARIADLVTEAQSTKAPAQRLADQAAAWFVPAVLLIAGATLAGWVLAGADFQSAFLRALTVVVVACPCALGLAVPTAIVAGTARAAEEGILIRDAAAIETLAAVREVLLDKTGTLTHGAPAVVHAWLAPPDGNSDPVAALRALAEASTHPVAAAIARWAVARGAPPASIRDFAAIPGRGVQARAQESVWRLGSADWLAQTGVSREQIEAAHRAAEIDARSLAERGTPTHRASDSAATSDSSETWLARDACPVARFVLRDATHHESAAAVRELRALHVQVRLLSGDRGPVVAALASELGVAAHEAELSPQQKLDRVREAKARHVVAMVGDGVNDAPALAAASVGMAIGAGEDLARDAADVCLLGRTPALIPRAIGIARRTLRVIHQNLVWAVGYNLIMLPAAIWTSLRPEWASAAMMLSSLSVVVNSLRLQRWRSRPRS